MVSTLQPCTQGMFPDPSVLLVGAKTLYAAAADAGHMAVVEAILARTCSRHQWYRLATGAVPGTRIRYGFSRMRSPQRRGTQAGTSGGRREAPSAACGRVRW